MSAFFHLTVYFIFNLVYNDYIRYTDTLEENIMKSLTINVPTNQELLTALKQHFPLIALRHIAENHITKITADARDGKPVINSYVIYSVSHLDDWYYMIVGCTTTSDGIRFDDHTLNYEPFDTIDEAEDHIKRFNTFLK
uniref:Uncharacterized protein n=1 Tax=Acinetobacter phage vB_AbaSt_W16 TaxID=3116434 RepID=A0AB38ZCM9_9CAUD